jgi:hypothetical protein
MFSARLDNKAGFSSETSVIIYQFDKVYFSMRFETSLALL